LKEDIMKSYGRCFCGAADAIGRSGREANLPAATAVPAHGETTMSIAMIPAAAWRAFLRFAGRHLARRTSRYLRAIDPRDLDALVREAREFASLMQAFRASVHRYWRRVCNERLADAQR
jgi:hypothetical protein